MKQILVLLTAFTVANAAWDGGLLEFYALNSSIRLSSRNAKTMLQTDAVYVTGSHGKLFRIPRNQDEIGQTAFVRHACVLAMGLHYYYNLTKEMECTPEGLSPFAAMYDQEELVGTAFTVLGSYSETRKRNWLDYKPKLPPRLVLQVLIHNNALRWPRLHIRPSRSPGLLNFHSYFVDEPGKITCLDQLNNLG